jgi:DNA-binding FadR family transcriptional regulator
VLTWPGRGLVVRQDTGFPDTPSTRLTVTGSGAIDLRLRVPSWAVGAQLRLNGTDVPVTPGGYARLDRTWASGDVVDLYRVRRLIECAALETFTPGPTLDALRQAVNEGLLAAKEERWTDVSTANMHFHQAVVALAGSPRLDDYMRQVTAELRLAFHVMQNPRTFHEPYLGRNSEILERLEAGDITAARLLLAGYLEDAERQVVAGYEEAQAR